MSYQEQVEDLPAWTHTSHFVRERAAGIAKAADAEIAALRARVAELEKLVERAFSECMKPLYAHPLALREPTDEECEMVWIAYQAPDEHSPLDAGRAMFNAVREVLK